MKKCFFLPITKKAGRRAQYLYENKTKKKKREGKTATTSVPRHRATARTNDGEPASPPHVFTHFSFFARQDIMAIVLLASVLATATLSLHACFALVVDRAAQPPFPPAAAAVPPTYRVAILCRRRRQRAAPNRTLRPFIVTLPNFARGFLNWTRRPVACTSRRMGQAEGSQQRTETSFRRQRLRTSASASLEAHGRLRRENIRCSRSC